MFASRWVTTLAKRCHGEVANVALTDSSRKRLCVPRNSELRTPPSTSSAATAMRQCRGVSAASVAGACSTAGAALSAAVVAIIIY